MRRAVPWAVGLAVVGVLLLTLVWPQADDGLLLAAEDVELAREHLRWREHLLELDAQPGNLGATDDASRALRARRTLLAARLANSQFAAMSVDDLRRGLEAAREGRFAPQVDVALRGVYGQDDRMDHTAVVASLAAEEDPYEKEFLAAALQAARSVGAWIQEDSLRGDGAVRQVAAETLGEFWGLCSGERFADQPVAGVGTAFLVAPDVVATAAHIFDTVALSGLVLVFDYEQTAEGTPQEVRDVYRPRSILAMDAGLRTSKRTYDWALVLLDREVTGRAALPIAEGTRGSRLRVDDALYMWGHSAGTPKKFARGAVRSNEDYYCFRAHLDAFGGDSGSPVFDRDHEVVGVLTGGSGDFRTVHARGGCATAAEASRRGLGEFLTRVDCFERELP